MKNNNLYDTVIKNGFCVGSGVFSIINPRIKTVLNEYGEYVALIKTPDDIDMLNDYSISKVCAMSDNSSNEDVISKELFSKTRGIKHHPIIGYYTDLYAGHVAEGDFRKNGSSGGMATWILKELLSRSLIDGVIHIKESKKKGILFEYGISRSIKEVCSGAKSRYYPAELSNVLNTIKKHPGKYAITGIPSIIMEVRLLSKQDKIIRDSIKYTIGLVCGHQKSTKYAECLAWQCGIEPGNLKYIDFRKKIAGKPAYFYATEMKGTINGKEVIITKQQNELLATDWGHGLFKTKFSDYSDDSLNETADISIGDAWLPSYALDGLGNNAIIVRNSKLSNIIKEGIKLEKLSLDEISTETLLNTQKGLIEHTRKGLPYRLFRDDTNNKWHPKTRTEASNNYKILRKIIQNLRMTIRDQSRIEYLNAVRKNDFLYFEKSMKKNIRRYSLTYKAIRAFDKIDKLHNILFGRFMDR